MDVGSAVPLSRGSSSGVDQAAPLDNNTGFAATPLPTGLSAKYDPTTGELVSSHDPVAKWELQARARAFLPEQNRLGKCHRVRYSTEVGVEVRKSKESGKAFYGGLIACGLVWLCPVCAPKVQAVRAAEVAGAIDYWLSCGGIVELVTFTVPHHRHQRLAELDKGVRDAYRSMTGSRGYRELMTELEVLGTIVAPEVTWGAETGWHPHLHVLRFRRNVGPGGRKDARASASPDSALFELWRSSVVRAGLETPSIKGFSVQNGNKAAEYVAKMATEAYTWGTHDELVRSHTKKGREGRYTPFDFLRQSVAEVEGSWRSLWRDYAAVYRGRRQLRWSPGLKDFLGASEGRTDEEVAASLGEQFWLLATLSDADWSMLRAAGARARGELLQVAELHGSEGVQRYLDALRPGR